MRLFIIWLQKGRTVGRTFNTAETQKGSSKFWTLRRLLSLIVRGKKQYVTTGNVSYNDKVTLFLMDYPHKARLKILGHAATIEPKTDLELERKTILVDYETRIEWVFKITVAAFDWNCQQHMTPRFTVEEIMYEVERTRTAGDTH